jgi:hypothetical protein
MAWKKRRGLRQSEAENTDPARVRSGGTIQTIRVDGAYDTLKEPALSGARVGQAWQTKSYMYPTMGGVRFRPIADVHRA